MLGQNNCSVSAPAVWRQRIAAGILKVSLEKSHPNRGKRSEVPGNQHRSSCEGMGEYFLSPIFQPGILNVDSMVSVAWGYYPICLDHVRLFL